MTMSRETNSREALNRRRALASVKAAVDRTSVAINNQIAVLADLRLKIREIDQLDNVNMIESLADIQLKASNEVKKLHSLINQLVQLRTHLTSENTQDKLVAPILSQLNSLEVNAQDEINSYMNELEEMKQKTSSLILSSNSSASDASSNGLLLHLSSLLSKSTTNPSDFDPSSEFCDLSAEAKEVVDERSTTIQLTEQMEQRRKLARAWKTLQRDVQDLNDTFKRLASSVWIQGTTVGRIEENITSATCNVNAGAVTLSKITKNSTLPLICAAVGTAFAGPIGFVAGYKLAAVAAVGTASLGYFSGKAVQRVTNLPAIEPPPPVSSTKDLSTAQKREDENG